MEHKKISFQDTHLFSSFFLDYIEQRDTLTHFYNRPPLQSEFEAQILEKQNSFSPQNRHILYTVMKEQYEGINSSNLVTHHLEALKEPNTFTVVTGHQLNIFSGPLYVIYKIVSVINMCRHLKKTYPDYTFVPLYWMASEDHDFEEINHIRLYGKKYTWKTDQQGRVGRFNPKSIDTLLKKMPGDLSLFSNAYLKHQQLSDAVRFYMNELFGKEGLLVIEPDCSTLKTALREIITEDLFHHTPKIKVEETNTLLKERKYTPQAYARNINFFYLDKNQRNRIEKDGNQFFIIDTKIKFNEEQMKALIQEEPEKFSPNVLIRPLYQEIILPNLAYVGGPAEIIYWLQLKRVFHHFKVPFPILAPRNFALIMNGPTARKYEKTQISLTNLFTDKHVLTKQWVLDHTHHHLTLNEEKKNIHTVFHQIGINASQIDPTLTRMVHAKEKTTLNLLENIESKLIKAEKKLHTNKLRQIEELKETLFPQGHLQERSDNFLNFYLEDPDFINKILSLLNPFEHQFNILHYPYK